MLSDSIVRKKGKEYEMKHKVIITILVILAVLSVSAVGALVFYPDSAVQILNSINSVINPTQPPTQPPTEPPTEPPTIPVVSSIRTEAESYKIEVGNRQKLAPAAMPENAENRNVSFSSSDKNIASVSAQGVVKALSQGECVITVASEQSPEVTAEYKISVTDNRIKQINKLNDYLLEIPNVQKVKYGDGKSAEAVIDKCRIVDFNGDGDYELFIIYSLEGDLSVAEVVTLQGGDIVSAKGFKSFKDVLQSGYDSCLQEIYTEQSGNLYIRSESIKKTDSKHTREVTFYSVSSSEIITLAQYKDVYNYENGEKVTTGGSFEINSEKKTESEYLSSLAGYFDGYTKLEDLAPRYVELSGGEYQKALTVAELDDAYLKRLKWECSDDKVAAVNNSGVVTAKGNGKCEVTATLSCFNGAICSNTVKVTNESKALKKYLNDIKDDVIKGESGSNLTLYASKILDIDDDGEQELLLYYLGSRHCQIDIAKEQGSQIARTTALARTTDADTVLKLEIFMDNSKESVVLQEKYTSTSGSDSTVEFYFDEYTGGKYDTYSSKYKIEFNGSKVKTCYIDGKKCDKDELDRMINHYGQYADWDINE